MKTPIRIKKSKAILSIGSITLLFLIVLSYSLSCIGKWVLTMAAKKKTKMQKAKQKYKDGTTYKDSEGKTRRRVSAPGTDRGDAYCARTISQKRTPKVKVRRKAWGCKGKKSVKK